MVDASRGGGVGRMPGKIGNAWHKTEKTHNASDSRRYWVHIDGAVVGLMCVRMDVQYAWHKGNIVNGAHWKELQGALSEVRQSWGTGDWTKTRLIFSGASAVSAH